MDMSLLKEQEQALAMGAADAACLEQPLMPPIRRR